MTSLYPVTGKDGKKDKRYSVALEYCGQPKRLYVLRFCGDFIGAFQSYPHAVLRAVGHKNPNPPIIEQKA